MNRTLKICIVFTLFSLHFNLSAQTRTKEQNNIGWYAYNGTFKVSSKIGLHTEYQWRRDDYITNWQQGLLRLGVNYNFSPNVQLRAGYSWIETFPYGEIPLNGFGKDFTEHRAFEMLTLQDRKGIVNLSHRFILEQRWVGTYSAANLSKEDDFIFLNRIRYMLRAQIPLRGKSVVAKTPYAAIYDELFIGFGENVGENVFDQNRFGALLGYKFSDSVQLEAGYLSQIVQLGREVDNKNVFQFNNGFIMSLLVNVDLTKKE